MVKSIVNNVNLIVAVIIVAVIIITPALSGGGTPV
jgi:hypothetical protein